MREGKERKGQTPTSAALAAALLASPPSPPSLPNVLPWPCVADFGICALVVFWGAEEGAEEEPMTRPGVEKLSGLLEEREQRFPILGCGAVGGME